MSFTYNFTKEITIPTAIDDYLRKSNIPGYNGCGYQDDGSFLLTVNTSTELSTDDQTRLTDLINAYVNPPYFLMLSRTNAVPLHSHFTLDDPDVIDGKTVLQTYIYNGNTTADSGEVLDGIKTVVEYKVNNVQTWVNNTTGSLSFEIYDISRNITITSRDIELGSIAQQWNQLAQTGSTEGSTLFRTELFTGMMNVSPGYDCVWQMKGKVDPPDTFDFRVNSYQELFYNKLTH